MLKSDPQQGHFSGLTHRNADIAAILDRLRLLQPDTANATPPLERLAPYLEKLGNPHLSLPPIIHIAGTNGKGSTLAFLQSILQTAGYRVHKFTSPHLVHFNERIVVNGQDVDDPTLQDSLTRIDHILNGQPIRFFDAITLAALDIFSRHKADVILLETGLGGRLDSTNIFDAPLVCGLSAVGLDHVSVLGDTHEKIAHEKCGIAKKDTPFAIGVQENENVYSTATTTVENAKAPPTCYGQDWYYEIDKNSGKDDTAFVFNGQHQKWRLPLPNMAGLHQIQNASLALAMLEQCLEKTNWTITQDDIATGLKNTVWRGRLQALTQGPIFKHLPDNTILWLDGGHNLSAANSLAAQITAWDGPTDIIMCISKKRDVTDVLAPLYRVANSITLVPLAEYERVICDMATLQTQFAESAFTVQFAPSWQEAVIKYGQNSTRILIAGSLYLAGDVLKQHR